MYNDLLLAPTIRMDCKFSAKLQYSTKTNNKIQKKISILTLNMVWMMLICISRPSDITPIFLSLIR